MSIDLSKLSAKELFELAQKKEQEEQQAAERQGKLDELKKRREAMVAEHKNILLLTDKKIRDMQEQRDKLLADQTTALASIDKEIKALANDGIRMEPLTEERSLDEMLLDEQMMAEPKRPTRPAANSGDNVDQLRATLRQIMNKRPYISASLLKEQLATYGIKPANFNKDLEQWVKDGWFEKQGMGNYVLGKRI